MELTERDYAYWLFNVPEIGNITADKLLCSGISCRDVYNMSAKELSQYMTARKADRIVKARALWDFEEETERLREKGIRFISRIEPEFPDKLKNIPNPPFAIYVKGKLPDPAVPTVAIIGARMCSEYGRYMSRHFGQGLAMSGVQIISGMARGIDGIAQQAALDAGGHAFGVLGCGADICYPPENQPIYDGMLSSGGIISEYPPGMQPEARFFPVRNRIISALADVVLVVEARQKSGTQITVDTALEQGREVMAVPGRVTDRLSDGCNYIISQGASVAGSVEDVLDRIHNREIFSRKGDSSEPADSDEMEEVKEPDIEDQIKEIVDIIPVSTSHILEELDRRGICMTVPELIGKLMDMTSRGDILQNGAYYRRVS